MIDAVELIASGGYRLLPSYRFDPHTGLWRHASGAPPPLLLSKLSYRPDGQIAYPRRRAQAGEEAPATWTRPGHYWHHTPTASTVGQRG